MKKRRVFSLTASIAGLFLMFMAFSAISLAEPPPQFQPMRPNFPFTPLLPDLSIEDIRLTPDCRVVVRVRNNGPGNLPDNVWTDHQPKSAGVYLTINGNKWGGGTIWNFDPARALKAPGGTAEFVSTLKVTSPSQVKAEVDIWNVVAEKNESNNWMQRSLSCFVPGPGPIGPGPIGPGHIFPLLPDLSIDDIRLTPDCRVVVRVRNNGPGNLPDNVWTDHQPKSAGVYLTINGNKWGGGTIWNFDPARALKAPG
ncbi:MAG: hypothetical protein HGA26_03430, partial [Chlorobiaceae bacterium]|nr:hypothetical protein [Chlorobiaceae bacterium]